MHKTWKRVVDIQRNAGSFLYLYHYVVKHVNVLLFFVQVVRCIFEDMSTI